MRIKIKYVVILLAMVFRGYAVTNIVAAENFYGELATEIGGNAVHVQSIISNPNADPHLFTTSPATVLAVNQAQIIIYNGADYDNWIKAMLSNIDKNKVIVINVAEDMGLDMQGHDFQWKIMNNTDPSPQMIINYAKMLNNHKVKVLFYNSQVVDPITKNMKDLATKNNIPIIGVTETMPDNMLINSWLKTEINKTMLALEQVSAINRN